MDYKKYENKTKESIDKPQFVPYEKSESYKLAREYEATLNEEQTKEAMERVESLTNRDYDNEL